MSRSLAALLFSATLALGACDDGSEALVVDLSSGAPVFFDTGANGILADRLIVHEVLDCQGRSMTYGEVWDAHRLGEALLDGVTYGETPEGARTETPGVLIPGREYYVELEYPTGAPADVRTSGFFIAGDADSFRSEGPHTGCRRDFDQYSASAPGGVR